MERRGVAGVMIEEKRQKEYCDLKGLYLYRDLKMWSWSLKYSQNYPVLSVIHFVSYLSQKSINGYNNHYFKDQFEPNSQSQ